MLDENLPTFYLRASSDGVKHNASILLSHYGSDARPEYSLRHPDPSSPDSKNRYAAALYDSYNPEILFGEVLLIPEWTQPNLSQEAIRINGGIPPPPQPVSPTEFTIQLYNPDQQVKVRWHASTWRLDAYWDFEMPQQSFRQPSTSSLDRTQSDPTASENTPKLNFKWKREGKISKDYNCSLSGKSTNPDGSKRKNKEPDIAIALFRHFKEITIYEPNLSRVDMEDPKGLEVVLLLGAVVIHEVFNNSMRDAFNITETSRRNSAEHSARPSTATHPPPRHQHSSHPPALTATQSQPSNPSSRPPPTDPRSQWELDAETTRLRKAVEAEERQRQRAEAQDTKRVKRMLEDEERKAREKQKEIDRETERLKKLYGKGQKQALSSRPPAQVPTRQSLQLLAYGGNGNEVGGGAVTAYPAAPVQRPHSAAPAAYVASNLRPEQAQAYDISSASGFVGSSSGGYYGGASGRPNMVPKKSFFGLRGGGDDGARLTKQRSTVF